MSVRQFLEKSQSGFGAIRQDPDLRFFSSRLSSAFDKYTGRVSNNNILDK